MRKCSIIFALFIIFLLIASRIMREDENIEENMTVALEVPKHTSTRP